MSLMADILQNTDGKWIRTCPKCAGQILHTSRENAYMLNKRNQVCRKCCFRSGFKGRKHTKESKTKMGCKSDFWLGKKLTDEHRNKLSEARKHIIYDNYLYNGGFGSIDVGATDFFNKLNAQGCNIQHPRYAIPEVRVVVDGYDATTHTIYEYDTKYHNRPSVQKRDIERQEKIIKYYHSIGKPLKRFIRIDATNGETINTVYEGK